MSSRSWLLSWVGAADHEAAEGKRAGELGPVASALATHQPAFDRIVLLTNYDVERSRRYAAWLQRTTGCAAPDLYPIGLASPIDYAGVYAQVSAQLKQLALPQDDVDLTFHLSPGTPAMAAIWIILAKTRFPARLIQTSKEKGLERVDFFFDLANEFLPEFLQRGSERIDRLSRTAPKPAPEFGKIIHGSRVMREQIGLASKIAAFEVPVLILGDTGTGKELFAEAIHRASVRKGKPFVAVNCGAIPKDMVNSELFGHVKGAYTGAAAERAGHFREAEGGVLFLDEIGDLPLDAQVRLLRVLQQREVTPLGASVPCKVDVRIVAATHRDLTADVAAGLFREDLFHRLAVGILRLPPLREREGDLDLLIDYLLAKINADGAGRPETQTKELASGGRERLRAHHWRGNVRELYHTLLRAAIWSDSATIDEDDVTRSLVQLSPPDGGVLERPLAAGFDLQGVLDEVSRHYFQRALAQSGWRKKRASDLLGFQHYQTFGNWAERLGIDVDCAE
ncbi:Fis family transcriptional regulator [Massilia sp. Root351]|uniref:RNA repair transcriptional activator RtcR family protein n=1 Tax=Massilia sp. Root351 TaxID=1736522 RepID=UPI00070AAD7D|nr:sigma 54-interacting transcriptional regulator [Massilia sp. Root351]KQV83936.1 Fis family transcriptional regulator [Massilia sp. Root351]